MSQAWTLSGGSYTELSDLGSSPHAGLSWHVVRDERDGSRHLLQLWNPAPPTRDLDRLKHTFLQRLTAPLLEDLRDVHFGYSERQAWFLQKLVGTPVDSLWADLGWKQRAAFLQHLQGLDAATPARVWHPEVIGVARGRVFVPRALGGVPSDFDGFTEKLRQSPEATVAETSWPWEEPPELSEARYLPSRGRQQELTYLKSLMYGLTAPLPMERIIVVQGEKGLGQDAMTRWAAAAAESEGIWVTRLRVVHGEGAGHLLGRLVTELIQGLEADFYASSPEAARRLSRRVGNFAFLRGGLRIPDEGPVLEPEEIKAAIQAIAFAHARHPRLIQIQGIERSGPEILDLLTHLALDGSLPWFFSCDAATPTSALKTFLSALHADRHLAVLQLNRLEDGDLKDIILDLLGSHGLPEAVSQAFCHAGLGNPSLLGSLLERSQLDGALLWQDGRWVWRSEAQPPVPSGGDLGMEILTGRLKRLKAPSASLVRALALADHPLPLEVLGRAVGLAGDPFEEALQTPINLKLAVIQDGQARLQEGLREAVMGSMAPPELTRSARSLLKALEGSAVAVPPVRLISLAMDEATALSHVLRAIEQPPPSPKEAEWVVHQSMALRPSPLQRARLWEYLADAWSACTTKGRLPAQGFGDRSPWELALDALGLAQGAFRDVEVAEDPQGAILSLHARLLQKKARLELRLHRLPEAQQSIQTLAALLADHPLHPEQPRLRMLLGRLHLQEGYTNKAVKAFEEGLQLVGKPEQEQGRLDQVSLLLNLGRTLAQKAHFQRALTLLQSAHRILEHDQDPRRLVRVLIALAHLHTALGQPDATYGHLRNALHTARLLDDLELLGECHMAVGTFRGFEDALDVSLGHLEKAYVCFSRLGDRRSMAHAGLWCAWALAALGDRMESELHMLRTLGELGTVTRPRDKGDFLFLQAEIATHANAHRDAARLYLQAAETFEAAGLGWRERLAWLRRIQALAQDGPSEAAHGAWTQLEQLKASSEGSGSRWLELEWHRAHGLLLGQLDQAETVAAESLGAWNCVLAAARQLRFHGVIIQACVESAAVLLARGERLGALSRLQEAGTSFHIVWSHVPDERSSAFLGRPDIQRFRKVTEAAGLPFTLPERSDPLSDWTPTQNHIGVALP